MPSCFITSKEAWSLTILTSCSKWLQKQTYTIFNYNTELEQSKLGMEAIRKKSKPTNFMEQSPSWEANNHSASQEIPPPPFLMEPKGSKEPAIGPNLEQVIPKIPFVSEAPYNIS
jgi:hypothetical protein